MPPPLLPHRAIVPFGHGLSCTTYEFANLHGDPPPVLVGWLVVPLSGLAYERLDQLTEGLLLGVR
jgi:hypothetical protein